MTTEINRPRHARRRVNNAAPIFVAFALMLALAGPSLGAEEELSVWRNLFDPQAYTGSRDSRSLTPGASVEMSREVWRVQGVTQLRVRSPEPRVGIVMRFRQAPPLPAESAPAVTPLETPPVQDAPPPGVRADPTAAWVPRLILVLIAEDGPVSYQYKQQGEAVEAGELVPRRVYTVGEGAETGLTVQGRPVRQIEIQDDGRGELRLSQEGGVLVVEVIPPAQGGAPDSTLRPFYEGRNLRHADAALMVGGYKNNMMGELMMLEGVALRVNGMREPGVKEVLALRVLATAQVWRSLRMSLWLDGGGGYPLIKEGTAIQPNEPAWTAGATLHYRQGNWGGAAHYATLDGNGLMSLIASWQFSRRFGVGLFWHSFGGLSAPGLSLSLDF